MAETWFNAKEWKARLVEFAGRRMLRNVANGETTTYDVSRSEGQVSQEGDAFNTKNMNDLEQRVANGFASAKTAVDTLSRDLHALNDSGAIKGMDAREDGVYITYVPTSGADAVTKKLGDALESTDGVVLMIHNHMNAKDSFQCMFNKEYIGQNSTSVRKFDVLRSGAYTYVFTHSPTGGSGSVSKILVNDKQIDYMEFISGPKSKSGSISLNTGDTVELVTGSYNSGHITNASMILRFQ